MSGHRRLTPPVGARDHVMGASGAPVTLVEYGDYECPNCARAYPIVWAARSRLGAVLRFAFRHFPLAKLHPHALHAAQVAEAAAAQGKFWEMHDMLLEHHRSLGDAALLRYAEVLQLDTARVACELEAGAYVARVRADFKSGVRSGVNGTPTFFVNGERYDGPWMDEDTFVAALRVAAWRAARGDPLPVEV